MPDFSITHHTRIDADQHTRVVRVDPHWRYESRDFSAVVYEGNVWTPVGDQTIPSEEWPDDFIQWLESEKVEIRAKMGFVDAQAEAEEAEAEEEDELGKLQRIMEEHQDHEESFDSNGKWSLRFLSDRMGFKIKRAQVNEVLRRMAADEQDE